MSVSLKIMIALSCVWTPRTVSSVAAAVGGSWLKMESHVKVLLEYLKFNIPACFDLKKYAAIPSPT